MAHFDPTHRIDPDEQAAAQRGRELVAAAVAQTSAPLALRRQIEGQRERAATGPRRRARRPLLLGGGVAGLLAATVLVVILASSAAGTPTVLATADLAGAGATLAAPAPDATNRALLDIRAGEVAFPQWRQAFDWRATGARRDELDGRAATTVFYAGPRGATAAYTILGGAAIDPAPGARVRDEGDTRLWVSRSGQRTIVTWERNGQTCVMSAPAGVPEDRLAELAAWDAGGAVPS